MHWQSVAYQALYQQGARTNMLEVLAILVLGYGLCLLAYRGIFSPLARIPGPRLAALTYWYETYYEVYKGGQYFRVIDEMHKRYGPIVRITPNEVHFKDPDFYDALYPSAGKGKIDRPKYAAARAGTPGSIVATAEHDVHRRRRNALNVFFSGASVRRMEPIIHDHMSKLLLRLKGSGEKADVIEPHHLFKACASDIITLHAFGDSFRFMDQADYGRAYFAAGEAFNSLTHVFGAFPLLLTMATSAPPWLVKYLSPQMTDFVDRREWWVRKVREIRNSQDPGRAKNTIFGGILESSLPASDKTDERLANEAQLVVFAGEGTTAHTLTSALYHLLANPAVLQKVKTELKEIMNDEAGIPTFEHLDRLRYLNAVISEVIRLHPGAMHRQVRVSPDESIIYPDKTSGSHWVVPPGVVYGISPLTCHMDEDVFQDPYDFVPERWIDSPEISRGFMGFSRGTRGCVGITLARRELAATLATIFIHYDAYHGQDGPTLELYDTVRKRDIDADRDYITPLPTKGSRGLRVRVRH